MRLATRPAGPRLLGPTNIKIKAINQVHKSTDTNNWQDMWNQNYDWNGWLKPGIDKVKALGANTVKIAGLGAWALNGAGTAFTNTLADRVRAYLDYTASVGLLVYWQVNSKTAYGTTSQLATTAIQNARILADYPHVVAMDLWNEPDLEGGASSSTIAAYSALAFPGIRAVTNIPLTVSVGVWPPDATNAYFTALKSYVDFWDFHCYWIDINTPRPLAANMTAFRASSAFKPYLMGESGAPRVFSSWPDGSVNQEAMWTRLGVFGQESDCLGVVGFCLTDYDAEQFGVFTEALASPKTELSGPFAGWRGVR